MEVKDYERKLNDIIEKAPMECGVQALVYNFLHELTDHNKLTIICSDLRWNDSIYGGEGGVPDLLVVSDEFKYMERLKQNATEEEKKRFRDEKKKRFGCVEVKAVGQHLPQSCAQIAGHIYEFGKVLYTNGMVWIYFECPKESTFQSIKDVIPRKLYSCVKEYDLDNKAMNDLKEKAGLKWIIPLVFRNKEVLIAATTGEKVIVDSDKFDKLKSELSNICWLPQAEKENVQS